MILDNKHIWDALSEVDTNALLFVDTNGIIRDLNKGVTTIFGYHSDELLGQPIEIFLPQHLREIHKTRMLQYVNKRIREQQNKSGLIGKLRTFPATVDVQGIGPKRFTALKKDQQEIPVTLTINEVWSTPDELMGFIAIICNNEEQYNLLQKLKFLSTYDKLTGLINWQEFVRKTRAIKEETLKRGEAYHAAILQIDIDYFKTITYQSQETGDNAIKKVAAWLLHTTRQNISREVDLVISRFIGDEFILYLHGSSLEGALTLANRLRSEFSKLNLRTEQHPFFSSISVGVARLSPSTSLHDALSGAASACRLAKEKGRDKIQVNLQDDTQYQKYEPIIRDALEEHRLKLYAQDIVAISPEALAIDKGRPHYEVLSRIEDENGKILSPEDFIPAAEKLGLAVALDMYVIKHTLALLKKYPGHTKSLSLCSINLSGASVSNERMAGFIKHQLQLNEIDPRTICFEVTETHEILDNDTATNLVDGLRAKGCKFAFDDFGTGHSNYQSFSRLPVDIVKIDGSYIRHILDDTQLRTDVEGMINSAKVRGLEIVAEYAENKKIVTELKRLGADYAQGYHFSKPIPLETVIQATTPQSSRTSFWGNLPT